MADSLKKQIAAQWLTALGNVAGLRRTRRAVDLLYEADQLPEAAFFTPAQRAAGRTDTQGRHYLLSVSTRVTFSPRSEEDSQDEVDEWVKLIRAQLEADRTLNNLALDVTYIDELYFFEPFDTPQAGAIIRHEILYRHQHAAPDTAY